MNNLYYRELFNKFELPKVKENAPKIMKRKLDISPYKRVNNFI